MKLFGSSDQEDNDVDMNAPDDGFDAIDDVADDIEGAATDDSDVIDGIGGDTLSAPPRAANGGGGKKGLLLGVGAVAILALGGGYYYLTNMQEDAPIHVMANVAHKKVPPQPTPAPAVVNTAPAPVAHMQASADPLDLSPATAVPAPPMSTPPQTARAPVAPPVTQQETPQEMNVMAAAQASAGAPPAAPPPDKAPQDLPLPPNAAAPLAPADTSSAAAPAWAQPGADVPVSQAEAGSRAAHALAASKPSDAEMAIVQNAAVLDQLSQPAAAPVADTAKKDDKTTATQTAEAKPAPVNKNDMKTVDELLQRDAIIRPMPEGYVTILKSHDAGDLDSRLTRARVALSQNNNGAALELFNQLLITYPKDSRAMMGRAVSLQKMGQIDAALGAYENVLNKDPKNLEALTNMLGLLKNKDPQLALEKLKALRRAYPYQVDITAQLGVVYAQMGDYDNALKYLNMAAALAPDNAYVLYNKAVLYDKMGHSEQAGDLYRQIIRMVAEGAITDPIPVEQIKQRLIDLR